MIKQIGQRALLLLAAFVIGLTAYSLLYRFDNKYTSALPGGYGYNVLPENGQTAFLVDGWEYYPGQLLGPEDFAAGTPSPEYTYIGKYSNFSAHLGNPYGMATYRLRLVHTGDPSELALYLPELLCAGRIYVNGALAGEQGCLEPYVPQIIDSLYILPFAQEIELIIQCANYSHYYSGMYYPPAVGTLNAILGMVTTRLLVYGILCFVSLAFALTHLTQWLLGRDSPTRWMGLLSLAFGLQVCYPFLRALGVPVIRPLYALEDTCSHLALLCAILLAGELTGMAEHRFHRRAAIPLSVGLCIFGMVFPLVILPHAPLFINAYGSLLFFWKLGLGLYLVVLAGLSLDQNGPLGRHLMLATGLYGLSVAASVLTVNYFEPAQGAWLEEYGGFILVTGFVALVVRRGVLLVRENRRLTLYLQEEVERKTQRMETLLEERRELLAHLLHDIKNPLAALRVYAELVRSGNVALDRETARYLDALSERAGAVEERFGQLQDFSRGEHGVFQQESLCLNTFLQQFYQQNRPDMELSDVTFSLALPAEPLWVRGSEDRLRTALENLCYNALSFTPEDGVITLALRREGQLAAITVRDTGHGIPPEDLPHVFTRGFTRRDDNSGDGLGLYIVRTVALEHNGSVDAVSQPGKGSLFTLRLPLLPAP